MATWTPPPTFTTAEDFAVTDANAISQNTLFLYQVPYAFYWDSAGTSCADSTIVQINLGAALFEGYGWTETSNNLIAPITGIYSVVGSVGFASPTTVFTFIKQNGTTALQSLVTTSAATQQVSGLLKCNAGDTIGLWTEQKVGSPQTTIINQTATYLNVFFVGSA